MSERRGNSRGLLLLVILTESDNARIACQQGLHGGCGRRVGRDSRIGKRGRRRLCRQQDVRSPSTKEHHDGDHCSWSWLGRAACTIA
jgi:hypothetical protein